MPESKLKQKILKHVHESPLVGHPDFLKTYRSMRERFSWKGLKGDVLQHVRACTVCQQNKSEHTLPAGLLQPLPIPEHKWESISMDFITGLPRVNGRDCIFVVVDRLTKYAHFFAIPSDLQAAQVANLFFREVFRRTGYPKTSSATGIDASSVSSGLNCFGWQELNYHRAQVTTRRQMAKLKF